jgi:DNA (cytosine-5)-methyltransferase 1
MVEWCAGYGGIHLGLKRAIPNLRVIAYGEIEAFACANLVAKMEAGLLDAAPIWTDIKTFPCEAFRDRVDILVAGYPCQPFSAAGKRLGTEDPRHLWPHIARAIRVIRPRMCFFENVEGHISLGLREVIGELESIGYSTAWGIFSASEVGAPHQRKRVFILAYDKSQRIQGHWADWLQEPRPHAGQGLPLRGGDAGCGELADAVCNGSGEGWSIRQGADGSEPVGHGQSWGIGKLADAGVQKPCGLSSGLAGNEVASAWECGHTAWPSRPGEQQHGWEPPRVVVADSKRGGGEEPEHLDANLSSEPSGCDTESVGNAPQRQDHGREPRDMGLEASQGRCGDHAAYGAGEVLADNLRGRLPHATDQQRNIGADDHAIIRTRLTESGGRQAQPSLGRDADGPAGGMGYAELCVACDNRTDELRLLGNGVVPATAERAFRVLIQQLDTPTPTH